MSNNARAPLARSRTGQAGKSSPSVPTTRIELCATPKGPCLAVESSSSKVVDAVAVIAAELFLGMLFGAKPA